MFKKLSLILCTVLFTQQSYATDVALGAGLSTLGFGIQGTFAVNDYVNVRLLAQGYDLR
jgi:hypothetical protein